MIQSVAPDGKFLFVNESWCKTMGYTNDELKDLSIFDIICPDSLEHCRQTFSRVMSGERVDMIEAIFTTKDGRQVNVEGNANTHFADGMPVSTLGIFRDVTERKRTEEDGRVKALLLETTSDAITVIDLDANFIYFNNGLMRMTGYTRDELFARRLPGILPPKFVERIKPNISMLMQRGEAVFESAYLCKDGTLLPIEVHAIVNSVNGRPAVISAVRDITERKRADEALREREERFRRISEDSPLAVLIVDRDGKIEYVNKKFIEIIGYNREEVPTLDYWWALAYPDETTRQKIIGAWSIIVQRIFSGGKVENIKRRVACKDGTHKDLELRFTRASDKIIVVFDDITERSRAEKALLKSEERYRSLINNLNVGVYRSTMDAGGQFIQVNPALIKIFGFDSAADLVQVSAADLYQDPDERNKFIREVLDKGSVANREVIGRKKDGTPLWMSISASAQTGQNGEFRWIDGIVEDITERKKAEAEHRIFEEQLRQSQKMEAVGRLAGGIAHDFNNLLSAIMGYASIAHMKMRADDPLKPHLREILAASERAASLTDGLLMFSRKQVTELKPVDVNGTVGGFNNILSRLIGEDIALNVHLAPHDLIVNADRGQLEQVLMNLVTNARDAMPRGGAINISTGLHRHGDSAPAAFAVLTVSDTGVGMDRETQEHIFEPFYTTKAVGEGTGLGLAIVYGIIEKHGGTIGISSEPGSGTTFRISLPLLRTGMRNVSMERPERLPSGTETILLVEDDALVRAATNAMLKEYGYAVMEAVDGEDAVKVFRENQHRIHLVLSDLIMNKMNGREAFEEMKKLKADIRSIFISGYTSDIILKKGILEEGINFVQKPLRTAELLNKIREVLEA
jgi:PAS domain S-box-containing protein